MTALVVLSIMARLLAMVGLFATMLALISLLVAFVGNLVVPQMGLPHLIWWQVMTGMVLVGLVWIYRAK